MHPMHSSLLMLQTAQSVVLCTGLTKLRSLRMDSCKALHPKGSDHFRFLAGMPRLTELSWRAHSGKPDWIEPDASVAGAEIGAMCLLMHAHKLTNLQRWSSWLHLTSCLLLPALCFLALADASKATVEIGATCLLKCMHTSSPPRTGLSPLFSVPTFLLALIRSSCLKTALAMIGSCSIAEYKGQAHAPENQLQRRFCLLLAPKLDLVLWCAVTLCAQLSCSALHRRLDLSRHSLCAVDVTMSCVACLTSLTHLELSRTYCSDSLAFNNSLAGLASLSRLCHLDLSHTEVEGSGLEMFCKTVQVSH